MKTGSARPVRSVGVVCAVAAVVLPALFTASAGEKTLPSQIKAPEIRFAPLEVRRNSDGSLKRNQQSEMITKNWSGYIIRSAQTGEKYTSAEAIWTVPKVTYFPHDPSFPLEAVGAWVGVGAACLDDSYLTGLCDNKDHTLIQVVTGQRAAATGTTYTAFYEMLPAPAVPIPLPISPGDRVAGAVRCIANCSSATQTWTLSMTNQTTGGSWEQTFTYASLESSAEWIVEAPTFTGIGIVPLANFDIATLGPQLEANGKVPKLTVSDDGFEMENRYGQWANPSDAERGQNGNFNVCWYDADPTGTDCLVP